MQDAPHSFDISLAGLDPEAWRTKMAEIADEHGTYQPLGDKHFATFIDDRSTLIVTFESMQGIQVLSDMGQPLGFDLLRALGWSHLCIVSDGDTWFRDPMIYEFFDRLIDDAFFEDFDRVVFYGAGPCGYAACAFSIAAPGATVIAVQPQATLDPRIAGWDDRFDHMRRTSFTDRYGFAPEMLDGADHAFVFYDPMQPLDAMHAALFHRSNVDLLRMPHMGAALQTDLMEMKLLYRILAQAGLGKFDADGFGQMYRARRDYPPYLRNLLARLEAEERPELTKMLCRNVTSRMKAPRFRRRLVALEAPAEAPDADTHESEDGETSARIG
ncbi:phosphoadenosine phosphosulfate reductase [Thalassococcus sp. S3]|uniref:phosphoadenosine phosphosulfate reductase n=1 Tax=Thalassococcus sp. S3 TaxID=2017482 RepID=UPI0010242526|nr:phosphoadenosine phosphosulfate reductase [Thalassococcus sp. S3]QBF31400.1 phosphoadenosine phosphosulfate reductase [Thalassococcus sp. S3]